MRRKARGEERTHGIHAGLGLCQALLQALQWLALGEHLTQRQGIGNGWLACDRIHE